MSDISLAATVSRIWNEIEGGYIYDDSRLNPTLIRGKVLVERAKLLTTLYMSYPFAIPDLYYQRCCFDIVCKQVCDSPMVETVATIPNIIGALGARSIKYVGGADGKSPYERTNGFGNTGSYSIFAKKKKASYHILGHNTAIFENLPEGVKKGMIIGLFADPFACECLEDENSIYIPADHVSDIEKAVKLELSGFLLQRKIDKRNNANSDN